MPGTINCDYCRLPVRVSDVARTVAAEEPVYCCYGCSFAAAVTRQQGDRGQATWMLTRLGLAAFLSMSVMICSIYLYGREVYESGTGSGSSLSATFAHFLRYVSLLLSTPVLFLLGIPILRNARSQWRCGVLSTDALVVLGVASAFIYSYVSTLRGTGGTYFETACMILVLVTLGRWFEAVGRLQATDRVHSLESLLPSEVLVTRDGKEIPLPLDALRVGDLVRIHAGDRIAVDGVIETGRGDLDEQFVTGESLPVARQIGDAVSAGTMNLDGDLTVRATAVGSETTLAHLNRLLESARAAKGHYERMAERAARGLLPLAIGLSMVAAVLGYGRGGADEAILSALSVLLIACPCGLGIATPLAVWVSLGRAASTGALFRTGESIEKLARVGTVFMDKTGTLTTGLPRVEVFAVADERERAAVRAGALALASRSRHGASQAIAHYINTASGAGEPSLPDSIVTKTIPGRGICGEIGGQDVFLGNVALMEESGLRAGAAMQRRMDDTMSKGRGIVCIGWQGEIRGLFSLDEELRDGARAAVRDLESTGCRVAVLTGDHARRGIAVSEALGIEGWAALRPADKAGRIRSTPRNAGLVAMVGDGLNDAPAMAAADVGIAMGCGADITRESADICLVGNDPASVARLIRLARRTVRTIRMNLFWAFFYNAIGLALAVSGRLSPVIAAAAMVASSLFVIGNSLRLGAAAARVMGCRPDQKPQTRQREFSAPSEHRTGGQARWGDAA